MRRHTDHSLGSFVYESIRQLLRDGQYRPGDRLREEELAQRLNVSRTPVREALGRLQAKRFLESAGARGLVVRRVELRDVLELYTVREIVEGAAARLAAEHATAAGIEALAELNTRLGSAAEDPAELSRLDAAFHRAIQEAANNRYLDYVLDEIDDTIGLFGATLFSDPDRVEVSVAEHAAIVDAVAARDPVRAEDAAKAHIRGALQVHLRVLQLG